MNEYVDLNEVPRGRGDKSDYVFKLLKKLPEGKAVKVKLEDLQMTVGGVRYCLREYAKKTGKEFGYSQKTVEGVTYIYLFRRES